MTDAEAFEHADAVFIGTLVDIITPPGDILVSSDPERFPFDVDGVFKGEVRASQSLVTAREEASCGLGIGGPGPFVVVARIESDGITSGAVEGELYSNLCSGARPLADGALPPSLGGPSSPAAGASVRGASSSPVPGTAVIGVDQSERSTVWVVTIAGVIALVVSGLAFTFHRLRATNSRRVGRRSS